MKRKKRINKHFWATPVMAIAGVVLKYAQGAGNSELCGALPGKVDGGLVQESCGAFPRLQVCENRFVRNEEEYVVCVKGMGSVRWESG